MTKLGTSFLEASVGPVVRRLCAEGIAIEVDPLRNDRHMDVRDIERNVTALATWCNEFWKAIWATRGDCPQYVHLFRSRFRVQSGLTTLVAA